MIKKERQDFIFDVVQKEKYITVSNLAEKIAEPDDKKCKEKCILR